MIIDNLTTPSIVLHESMIPFPMFEFLSMTNIIKLGSTQPIDTEMLVVIDILVISLVVPIEQIVTPSSSHGSLLF